MKFKELDSDKKYVLFLGFKKDDNHNAQFLEGSDCVSSKEFYVRDQAIEYPLTPDIFLTPKEVKKGIKWLRKEWFAKVDDNHWKLFKQTLKASVYEEEEFKKRFGVDFY